MKLIKKIILQSLVFLIGFQSPCTFVFAGKKTKDSKSAPTTTKSKSLAGPAAGAAAGATTAKPSKKSEKKAAAKAAKTAKNEDSAAAELKKAVDFFVAAEKKLALLLPANATTVEAVLVDLKHNLDSLPIAIKNSGLKKVSTGVSLTSLSDEYKKFLTAFKAKVSVSPVSKVSPLAYLDAANITKILGLLSGVMTGVEGLVKLLVVNPLSISAYTVMVNNATNFNKTFATGATTTNATSLTASLDKLFTGFSFLKVRNAQSLLAELSTLNTEIGKHVYEATDLGKTLKAAPDMKKLFADVIHWWGTLDKATSAVPVGALSKVAYLKADDIHAVTKDLTAIKVSLEKVMELLDPKKSIVGYKTFTGSFDKFIAEFKHTASGEVSSVLVKDMTKAIEDAASSFSSKLTTNAGKITDVFLSLNKAVSKITPKIKENKIVPSAIPVSTILKALTDMETALDKKTSAVPVGKLSFDVYLDADAIKGVKKSLTAFHDSLNSFLKGLVKTDAEYKEPLTKFSTFITGFKGGASADLAINFLNQLEKAFKSTTSAFGTGMMSTVRNGKAVIKELAVLDQAIKDIDTKMSKEKITPGKLPSKFTLFSSIENMLHAFDAKTTADKSKTSKLSSICFLDAESVTGCHTSLEDIVNQVQAFCKQAFVKSDEIAQGLEKVRSLLKTEEAQDAVEEKAEEKEDTAGETTVVDDTPAAPDTPLVESDTSVTTDTQVAQSEALVAPVEEVEQPAEEGETSTGENETLTEEGETDGEDASA